MKLPADTKLITVGELVDDLTKLKDEYSETCITCRLPDDRLCCITGMIPDEDGNLKILIEEEDFDGAYYDVDMLLFEIDSYDRNTPVYMEDADEPDLCLTVTEYKDEPMFSYDEVNDNILCDVSTFLEK